MIKNATLLRIDTPSGSSPAGKQTWATGDALSPGIRCSVQNDKAADAYTELAKLTEGRASTLRVESAELAFADLAIGTECRVLLQLDGEAAATLYRVRSTAVRPDGSLSFFEAFLTVD